MTSCTPPFAQQQVSCGCTANACLRLFLSLLDNMQHKGDRKWAVETVRIKLGTSQFYTSKTTLPPGSHNL